MALYYLLNYKKGYSFCKLNDSMLFILYCLFFQLRHCDVNRAVQLIDCDYNAHRVSKAGVVPNSDLEVCYLKLSIKH